MSREEDDLEDVNLSPDDELDFGQSDTSGPAMEMPPIGDEPAAPARAPRPRAKRKTTPKPKPKAKRRVAKPVRKPAARKTAKKKTRTTAKKENGRQGKTQKIGDEKFGDRFTNLFPLDNRPFKNLLEGLFQKETN